MSNNIINSALTYITKFFNDNVFSEAKEIERFKKTPNKRVMAHIFKGIDVRIDFKHFCEYHMNDDSIITEFEEWNYENAQTFFYKNITRIKKVICSTTTDYFEYHLKKGKLHNINSHAYLHTKQTGNCSEIVEGMYFLNGKTIGNDEWKTFSRHLKLNRIIKNEYIPSAECNTLPKDFNQAIEGKIEL